MTKSFTLINTSDSILSRICLVSLIWLLLILGGFSMRAWGRTSSVNTAALWSSSTYSTGDSVVWSAPNVTFKLHNGGNIELYLSDHILIQKNQHYTLEWRVAEGYTINVTRVSVRARGTLQSYITVGTNKSGNIYSNTTYTTVNSQPLSLGNNGTVDIYPQSENRDDAIIHMDEITVTYTIQGVAKEVTIDSWLDFTDKKNEKNWLGIETSGAAGPFAKTTADGATFTLSGGDVRKWCASKESDTHFYLSDGSTATLSWTQPTGYTVLVEGIEINAFTARSNGKLYIWSNNNNSDHEFKVITENESNNTNSDGLIKTYVYNTKYNDTKGVSAYLFPSGNKMGVSDNFKLKPTSREGRINWINLTYTINPNSYDITLNNETPTVAGSSSVTVTYDANSQLSITNPTKDGYTFDGWYTTETDGNGSGTKVIDVDGNLQANVTGYTGASGVWKKDATTTLYAKWILNGIKDIMLDNQGATTAGTDSLSVRFMTDHYSKASISAPAKTGYTFDGYYSASSDGVQVIDADGNVVADVEGYTDRDKKWINGDDETTLYAHWTGVPYSVRFNGNGSTDGSMSNQAFVYGTAQNLTANVFEKTCTVTYDANGGSCGIASSETPFSFLGWATSEGGDVVYEDEKEVGDLTTTEDAVVDLYAKWSATADAVELPMPTKDNCVFAGWYNLSDEKIGDAGASYTPTADITLKAHWRLGAASKNSDYDISSNSIIMHGPHATFTFSGETNITDFKEKASWPIGSGKPEGYKLVQAFDKNINGGRMNYSISWATTNANCSIQVTKISFWVKAYNSNAGNHEKAKVAFAGDTLTVGTAALTANEGDYRKFSKETTFAGSSVAIVCLNNTEDDFDYYIKNISIEYEVYTTAPSPTDGVQQVNVTINVDAKQTVDLSSLFTYAVTPPSDFTYTYEIVGSPASAGLQGGTNFWASVSGDYSVRAKVATAEDHHGSEWSSTKTIRVKRVPYIFNNSQKDEAWATTSNWNASWLPTSEDSVIIRGDLVIDNQITVAKFSIENEAIVNIAPTGGLTVGAGGIIGATKDKLKLKASREGANKGKTGYLRLSPEYAGEMPEVTTELYTIGYYDKSKPDDDIAAWQYVGSPIDFEGKLAKTVFTRSWIYSYVESTDSWVNNRSTLVMQPFTGYKTTQYDEKEGKLLSFKGKLIPNNCLYTIDLACTDEDHGHNLVANSFAAPISIAQFRDTDFVNAEKTIYIYNTGSRKQYLAKGAVANSAGQYTSIAISTAAEMEAFFGDNPEISSTIAPMQGFFVNATGAEAKLKFDYSRLVWNVASVDNQPLRSPKRATSNTDITAALKITLEADSLTDNVYMLESEGYELEYEDGYDAHKLHGGKFNVFTIRNDEQLAIDATNSIIGTRVGVRTGEETAYTLEFSHLTSENGLALYDSETEQTIDINEGTQYAFFAEPNAMITERFEIVARADAPAITTGVDKVENGAKVHKFIKDNQLFILKNGVLYNATGAVVR